MPKRKSVRRFPCDDVQGEGSYIVLAAIKVKQVREMRKKAKDPEFDDFEGGVALLAEHILSWNFVDDEGNPLPLPKDDPTVIDELTNEESEFIVDLLLSAPKN